MLASFATPAPSAPSLAASASAAEGIAVAPTPDVLAPTAASVAEVAAPTAPVAASAAAAVISAAPFPPALSATDANVPDSSQLRRWLRLTAADADAMTDAAAVGTARSLQQSATWSLSFRREKHPLRLLCRAARGSCSAATSAANSARYYRWSSRRRRWDSASVPILSRSSSSAAHCSLPTPTPHCSRSSQRAADRTAAHRPPSKSLECCGRFHRLQSPPPNRSPGHRNPLDAQRRQLDRQRPWGQRFRPPEAENALDSAGTFDLAAAQA